MSRWDRFFNEATDSAARATELASVIAVSRLPIIRAMLAPAVAAAIDVAGMVTAGLLALRAGARITYALFANPEAQAEVERREGHELGVREPVQRELETGSLEWNFQMAQIMADGVTDYFYGHAPESNVERQPQQEVENLRQGRTLQREASESQIGRREPENNPVRRKSRSGKSRSGKSRGGKSRGRNDFSYSL